MLALVGCARYVSNATSLPLPPLTGLLLLLSNVATTTSTSLLLLLLLCCVRVCQFQLLT